MKFQTKFENQEPFRRDRLLRLGDVEALTGCKKSHLYALMRVAAFPKNIRLSYRHSVWSEAAVLKWIQERLETPCVTRIKSSK